MSVKRLATAGVTVALVSFAMLGGALAQSSGGGSPGGSDGGGSASGAQPSGASETTGGMGGRLRANEGGVPGGPESEKRILETKSLYTTCPDGSRGDLNAGGCLGGRP